MGHFGIVCPPTPGHLNPLCTLGRALQSRGHAVTLFQVPDVEPMASARGVGFHALGAARHPMGSVARAVAELSTKSGLEAARFSSASAAHLAATLCEELPAALQECGVDALVVDQNEPAGGTVAERLRMPFVTVCAALPINREPDVPPPYADWSYSQNAAARLRNKLAFRMTDWIIKPLQDTVNRYRKLWHLPILRSPDDSFSPLAQITAMVAELDFPRKKLPQNFYYTGPFSDDFLPQVGFPWDKLDGRQIVYASLGTLQNGRSDVFELIAAACAGLPVQTVISLGRKGAEIPSGLPGQPLVVDYVPQQALLPKVSAMVTHAGMNSALECLAHGVPAVAIPITNDQPAVAARMHWRGVAEVIPFQRLTVSGVKRSLEKVLGEESFRLSALTLKQAIEQSGGVQEAADLTERVCGLSARVKEIGAVA